MASWLLPRPAPAVVMAAASRGAARVEGHLVVGVLPDEGNGDDRQRTAALDLALFTGMGKARNVINVLSADVVVICMGGAGELPCGDIEIQLGRQIERIDGQIKELLHLREELQGLLAGWQSDPSKDGDLICPNLQV